MSERKALLQWLDLLVITGHIALTPVNAVTAVQMNFGRQPAGDVVDRRQRLRELPLDVPLPAQPLVVRFAAGGHRAGFPVAVPRLESLMRA